MDKLDESKLPQMIAQAAAEQSFETPRLEVQDTVREADRRRLIGQLTVLAIGAVLTVIGMVIGIAVLLETGRGKENYWIILLLTAGMMVWAWSGVAAVGIFCKKIERQREKGVVK